MSRGEIPGIRERISRGTLIEFTPVGAEEEEIGIVHREEDAEVIVHPPDDVAIRERVPYENITDAAPLGLKLSVTNPSKEHGAIEVYTEETHKQLVHRINAEEDVHVDITDLLDQLGYEILPKEPIS